MNKKFSTRVAALLAASAMSATAFAQVSTSAKVTDLKTVESKQAYVIAVNPSSAPISIQSDGWLDMTAASSFVDMKTITEFADAPKSSLWTITPIMSNGTATGKYTIVALDGTKLAFGNDKKFNANGAYSEFQFSDDVLWINDQGQLIENQLASSGWKVSIFKAADNQLTEKELEEVNGFGTYFGVKFGKIANNEFASFDKVEAEGNVFAGNLYAKAITASTAVELYTDADCTKRIYALPTKAEKWSFDQVLGAHEVTCRKFAAMTYQEARAFEKANGMEHESLQPATFDFTQPITSELKDAPLTVKVNVPAVGTSVSAATEYLYIAEVNKVGYVTTINDVNKLNVAYSCIRFGLDNNVQASDFYGYAWNVECIKGDNNGKTLKPNAANDWEDADHVAFAYPEGQWIVSADGTLVNRETQQKTTWNITALRSLGNDVYSNADGKQQYRITKAATLGTQTWGYYGGFLTSDIEEGRGDTYKISFMNAVTGQKAYVGRDGIGNVVLTDDVLAAIEFQANPTKTTDVVKANGERDENKDYDVFSIVNACHTWDAKKEAWVANQDTINYNRFDLSFEGKYLKEVDGKLTLVAETDKVKRDNFVIKLKDNGEVNIINVTTKDFDDANLYGSDHYKKGLQATQYDVASKILKGDDAKMLYFDFNNALLKQQQHIYNWVANAQLVLDNKAVAEYRTLAAHDTLEFFRTEYKDEFLYENKEFLGMTVNRIEYNPAIFVDTAYVRNNPVKPTYMLAVGVEKTDATMECPICHKADCPHAEEIPGMIAARYLVSYTDSVAVHAKELDNKFYFDNTKFTKLGFVDAVHNVDSLVISSTNDKWIVGANMVSPVTFAFRIVDQENQDFIIETGRLKDETKVYHPANNNYRTSYVKWHNGCPVLTNDIKEAEVFNVRETSEEPTANEGVEVSEVSVVAANGAVIVKGAEGKKVAISNILGQTIANAVVSSDNATIAVPAGIVVVAVEGEDAVKVVVK